MEIVFNPQNEVEKRFNKPHLIDDPNKVFVKTVIADDNLQPKLRPLGKVLIPRTAMERLETLEVDKMDTKLNALVLEDEKQATARELEMTMKKKQEAEVTPIQTEDPFIQKSYRALAEDSLLPQYRSERDLTRKRLEKNHDVNDILNFQGQGNYVYQKENIDESGRDYIASVYNFPTISLTSAERFMDKFVHDENMLKKQRIYRKSLERTMRHEKGHRVTLNSVLEAPINRESLNDMKELLKQKFQLPEEQKKVIKFS